MAQKFRTLIGDWSTGTGPLYRRLAASIAAAIERGVVPVGERMPSERAFAEELAVSRRTVVAAYALLKSEGWLASREGSGTRTQRPASDGDVFHMPSDDGDAVLYSKLIGDKRGIIDLTLAALPASPLIFDTLSQSGDDIAALMARYHGYLPLGLPELRESIAGDFMRRGLPTHADDVLVTTGSQQAITLTARLLARPGDAIAVENPTNPGALDAFHQGRFDLVPLDVDSDGIAIDRLQERLTRRHPQLLYVTSSFHNPTGAVLSLPRRRALLEICARLHVPIIDDLAMVDFSLGDSLPPPLAKLDTNGIVITVGSADKLFWGGLRIGWARAPRSLIVRIGRLKSANDLGSSLISQLLTSKLLPLAERAKTLRSKELGASFARAARGLRELLPSWKWEQPRGGLSLWIELPWGNAEQFSQIALRHGVNVVPGSAFSVDGRHTQHLRLSCVAPAGEIDEGIRRLALAWETYQRAHASASYARPVI
ncbi:MAG TPA: PLP-dependent aminotransferase family protein [Candidatus Baltobacteraceae bacterium]|nr:PLP-dependent aminotransferase family protein [Candidatus Baltobacteraceae bacterium]